MSFEEIIQLVGEETAINLLHKGFSDVDLALDAMNDPEMAIDLMHGDATERMTALNDALVAVRRSIDILMDQSAQQTVQKNAKLVYLHTERAEKRGR